MIPVPYSLYLPCVALAATVAGVVMDLAAARYGPLLIVAAFLAGFVIDLYVVPAWEDRTERKRREGTAFDYPWRYDTDQEG